MVKNDKSIEIQKIFQKATIDGISAYLFLPFSKELIEDNYLVIGIEESTSNLFKGVILDKKILNENLQKNKSFYMLNIKLPENSVKCVLNSSNSWQTKYMVGVLSINTTTRKNKVTI